MERTQPPRLDVDYKEIGLRLATGKWERTVSQDRCIGHSCLAGSLPTPDLPGLLAAKRNLHVCSYIADSRTL
jgi:hypothetical protein